MFCNILLYGEDEYTKNNVIKNISREVLGKNISDLNYEAYYSDEIELTAVLEKAYIEPFFSGNKIIIVKFLNAKIFEDLKNDSKKALIEYVKAPSKKTCLILSIYGSFARKNVGFFNELLKLNQQKKSIEITEFKLLREDAVYSFIRDRCKKAGKSINSDTIGLMLEKSGNDLLNLENELNKIFLFVGDRNIINMADVENVVIDGKTRNIFELVNFIGDKRINECIMLLNSIIKQEEDASIILGSIVKHFRRIWIIKSLASKSKREFEIAKVLRTKEFFVHNVMKQINNFSFENLAKNFEKLLEADLDIKTGILSPKFILESLLLNLCS